MYINPIINFALAFFYYGERASSAQWVGLRPHCRIGGGRQRAELELGNQGVGREGVKS
jgi:hypothetical protein